jgi:hypothetical protein
MEKENDNPLKISIFKMFNQSSCSEIKKILCTTYRNTDTI